MQRRTFLSAVSSAITETISKAAVSVTNPVSSIPGVRNFFGGILESFGGAWQRNVVVDSLDTMLATSAVYACVTLISNDISKLRIKLVKKTGEIWPETESPAFSPVLRKPNRYQTRIQFLSQWVVSKLLYGNTYVLKERDNRGIVVAMYVLDPKLVTVLVSDDGQVYYRLANDKLSQIGVTFTAPASEIIHDRCICPFHPLVGVPPIYACALSSTQGNRIQAQSSQFFENMSRPSGHLTADGTITDPTAARLKAEFESAFAGKNLGRLLVTGDGLKYEPMTIPANQAQLIEQLKWTAEDVCSAFLVPLYKISKGSDTKLKNAAQQDQDYYKQTLQHLIESIESLLDEGLGLMTGPEPMGTELDLEGLLRMDPVERSTRSVALVKGGIMAPNEARAIENLPNVTGGEEPYLQQQNFPLSQLVNQPPPGSTPALPAPAADPAAAAAAQAASDAAAKALDLTERMDAVFRKHMDAIEAGAKDATARGEQLQLQFDEVRGDLKAIADKVDRQPQPAADPEPEDEAAALAAELIAQFTAATTATQE